MKRLTLLLALLVALGAAGCGGGETDSATPETVEGTLPADTSGGGDAGEGDAEAGAGVYAEGGCGGCHTFGRANSSGTVGPNLDESDMSYEDAVEQIRKGGNGMPAFEGQLTDQQIADVAAFVTEG